MLDLIKFAQLRRGWFSGCAVGAVALGQLAFPAVAAAQSLPEGGTIIAGSGALNASANRLDVQQNSDKLVIDWSSFSVGRDDTVNFFQPSATAIALNRVTGADVSTIQGQVHANGRVFLVNPNGVLFTPTAQVEAGSLVASTLNIATSDFLAGRYDFSGSSLGSIVNRGSLTALGGGGHGVALIAAQIRNDGTITAGSGTVALAAGSRALLDLGGPLQLSVDGGALGALIDNGGAIRAVNGSVYLTARALDQVVRTSINNSGVIEATGLRDDHGVIVLDGGASGTVETTGSLVATGSGRGGDITLLGSQVGVLGGAVVDASGQTGGGTIRIGGDYQGGGSLPWSSAVVLGEGARVESSALAQGDGGQITLWSGDYTGVYGQIRARGGAFGGAGGRVETSSKHLLEVFGTVDVSAGQGAQGNWLLDPTDVTIGSTGTTSTYTVTNGTYAPNNTTGVTIAASTLASALASGDVTVNTVSAGAMPGNITVSSAITKASGSTATTLTLNAANNITIGAAIAGQSGVPLNITLNAANNASSSTGGVAINANLSSFGGKILIGGAGGSLTTTVVQGIGYALNRDSSSLSAVAIAGGVTVASNGGQITINGLTNIASSSAYAVDLGASAVVNSAGGNLYVNGRNTNASSSAFAVNLANGTSTLPTTLGTTTGSLQLDAYSAYASTNSLNLASTGGSNKINFNGPNVASIRVVINGAIQASTFTAGGCTAATNYLYCGQLMVPGANGSTKYGNYNTNYSATIPLYVSWTSGSKTYDGTTTATGMVQGTNYTLTSSSALPTDFTPAFTLGSRDVGSYATLTGGVNSFLSSNGSNYAVAYFNDGTYTINAKALTMSGLSVASSRTYNGTTVASVSGTAALLAAIAAGSGTSSDGKPYTLDTVSITGTPVGTYNSKDVGSASSVSFSGLSLTGANAGNYTLTIQPAALATITAKNLSLSGLSVASRAYDATTTAVLSGTAGLLSSESAGTGTTSDGKPYTGDTVSVTGTASGAFGTAGVGVNKGVTVSGLSLTGGQAGNYQLVSAITGTITAKALTMSGLTVPTSRTYDGTLTAAVGGTGVLQTAQAPGAGTTSDGKPYTGDQVSITGTPVGTYNSKDVATASSVSFSGLSLTGNEASNYSLTTQSAALATITAKALTMSGLTVPTSRTYDGTLTATVGGAAALLTAQAPGAGTTSDGKPYTGDQVSIAGTAVGTYNFKDVSTASSVSFSGLSLTGNEAGNYNLTTQAAVQASIVAKALTVSGINVSSRTYDATTTASLSGMPVLQAAIAAGTGTTSDGKPYSSDSVSVSGSATAAFADADAGQNKVVTITGLSLTGGGAGNYSINANASVTADIYAKALTMSGLSVPTSRTYDGTQTAVVSGTATLLAGQAPGSGSGSDGTSYTGDQVSITGTAVGTYNSKNVVSASSVTYSGLSLTGTQAHNYTLTVQSPDLATITALQLVPQVSNKVYDGSDSASISATGVISGDDVLFQYQTGSFSQKDVGQNLAVTASGISLTGNDADNYTLGGTSVSATASITARPLTITGTTVQGKTYDATRTAQFSVGTLGNLVPNEDLGVAASGLFGAADAGSQTATATYTLSDGTNGLASNYTLASTTGLTATISRKALTMSGLTVPTSRTYDGTLTATVGGTAALLTAQAPGAGTTVDGTPYTGDQVSIAGTAVGTYNAKDVGSASSVSFSGLSLTGNQAGNYSLTTQGAALATITAKALTIGAPVLAARVYDGTALPGQLTLGALSGFVGTERVSASGTADGLTGVDAGTYTTTVRYTLADGINGGRASNYSLASTVAAPAAILVRPLTIRGTTALGKVYDGTRGAAITLGTLDNLVGQEQLTVSAAGVFDAADAGDRIATATYTLANGVGGRAANYSLAPTTGLAATIERLALSISGLAAQDKVYDGSTAATITGTPSVAMGLLLNDQVSVSGPIRGAFDSSAVGAGKPVTIDLSALSLVGAQAGNYRLAGLSQSLVAAITAADTEEPVPAPEPVPDIQQYVVAPPAVPRFEQPTFSTAAVPAVSGVGTGLVIEQADTAPVDGGDSNQDTVDTAPATGLGPDAGPMVVVVVQGGINTGAAVAP